jgi:hypothetical protein
MTSMLASAISRLAVLSLVVKEHFVLVVTPMNSFAGTEGTRHAEKEAAVSPLTSTHEEAGGL